ncbi:MAG: sigma 54-interacting transcriptional regulator [Spirochaetales bacterium]|nr:sigma 54-interacting transcriptional regulator [Spirochaetales bacterium]
MAYKFRSGIDEERFNTLIEINALINSNFTDVKNLLTRILESAQLLTNGEASSLLLVNPENNRLYFEISLGSKGPDVQKFSLNMGEGIAGWVAAHNTSLIVNDVEKDERFFSDISKQIGFKTNSIIAVPMRIKEVCVGVLELINKTDGRNYTEEDRQWLEIFATQAAIAIQNARTYQRVKEQVSLLQDQVTTTKGFHTFIGKSETILEKLALAEKVAKTDSSVLILGESGVGKELFAERIHLAGPRVSGPFIRVNCAALPEHLLESELFGHVKGAFTDATRDRRGRFELADKGTIFLDEIGDVPINLQAKLLRVIQQKVFEKVGSSEPQSVDVRILAATNKDLESAIENGTFRKDLYYRLNVLPLYIPPLRERPEDIPELADFFLKRINQETKKQINGFTSEALDALLTYSWPGNVRELENVIERAVVITDDDYIRPQHLILETAGMKHEDAYVGKNLREAIHTFKKHYIMNVLEKHGWKQTESAKALDIQRTYLSRLIKELDIK